MIGMKECSKIWRVGGWEDSSAIEEMNEVKREAIAYRVIAQRQEDEGF